ncbi:pentatricopeptide repeat-containing protein At4g30825, chloroplastic [Rutidosis leptorrhynchoides]|uniref:pentatricopeptide repeat-containing protein At4g30825, chloroplastic n=1 Tax=Rutidosis leptorrhynchoides TaxID=125765 RepID=UPI003A990C08
MASLKLPISFDTTTDSKKLPLSINQTQLPDQCHIFSITSYYLHVTRACIISSLSRVKRINVSRLETDLSDINQSDDANSDGWSSRKDLLDEQNSQEAKRKSRCPKKWIRRDMGLNLSMGRGGAKLEREDIFVGDGELDVNYSLIGEHLSLGHCNAILKRLERCSDSNSLKFFEWMRRKGKLERNAVAYNLVLRVLSRREEWGRAESIIREMSKNSGCELSFQPFNTILFACCKKGRVELCRKWFCMMLEFGVQPNVATFGMLMSLYQKCWNIEEAEFVFTKMRSFKIVCQSAYSSMITIYTRSSLYDKAEEVISLMRDDQVMMNFENWLVMLNAYCQQGKIDEAEKVFVKMQESGFSRNIVAYNVLITGYGKYNDMETAQRLFESLSDFGLVPDETTYRSMIEGWGRANNYDKAEWHYKELKRLGYKPNSSNLYTLINLQAKYGDEEDAIKTLQDMVKIGCQHSSILSTLLQAYERSGRIDKVPLILKGPFYKHVLVNQTSCSILVMAYVKHNLVDDAIKVLRNKKWKDRVFEENLYHLLICSSKELGFFENAVKIYAQMPKFDDRPNLHIICTMIDTYSAMGLFTEAEKLYFDLTSSGTELDMIAFSIVVRMYVKAGSLKDACAVLSIMEKQNGIIPDVYMFRDILRIYQQCGMKDKLQESYYKILKSGIPWDQEMYNCVINCCSRALPLDELTRIFDEMIHRGFTPSTITFNVMLDLYGKAKLFKKVRKLFLMAKKEGLIDVISYNTIVAAYGRNRAVTKMSSTVEKMQFDGFSVSLEAYNCMLDAYGKDDQMESFRRVLERMKELSCDADQYTYNIMMNIYGEKGWIDEVSDVLTELKENGVGPDLCGYNTLIKAYGIAGMVENAMCLVKEMRQNGIKPDKITYTNLITALKRNDKFLEAVRWSLWMKQMGV